MEAIKAQVQQWQLGHLLLARKEASVGLNERGQGQELLGMLWAKKCEQCSVQGEGWARELRAGESHMALADHGG